MIAVIGAGPAGLIAAETLATAGQSVCVFDHMPSPARKFLLAGRGGLNLTHSEPMDRFAARYGQAALRMAPALAAFPPDALRAWCEGLGQAVFIGSSGRVFPSAFKAAPLLRAWLRRLEGLGVVFAGRHRWLGWQAESLRFAAPDGASLVPARAVLLALGGASWPRMGSDGGWVGLLEAEGVAVTPLRAANAGVVIGWSDIFRARFEGVPLKRIAVSAGGVWVRGEAVVTRSGLEGGAIYGLGGSLRSALDRGEADILVDLRPDLSRADLSARVDGARGGRSLSNVLRAGAGLPPVSAGLVQEALHGGQAGEALSAVIKGVRLRVRAVGGIERAISSAGGVAWASVDEDLQLRARPGVFVAGEMLDWTAPTGGYLLQGCFATGVWAARGILKQAEQARLARRA